MKGEGLNAIIPKDPFSRYLDPKRNIETCHLAVCSILLCRTPRGHPAPIGRESTKALDFPLFLNPHLDWNQVNLN